MLAAGIRSIVCPTLVSLTLTGPAPASDDSTLTLPKNHRSRPAPARYQDFTLGMTRVDAWQTVIRLNGKELAKRHLVIPSYDGVQFVRLGFSDGLTTSLHGRKTATEPMYADAVVFRIHVVFEKLPRPIGDFPTKFTELYGKPDRVEYLGFLKRDRPIDRYGYAYNIDMEDRYTWYWPDEDVGVTLSTSVDLRPGTFLRQENTFLPTLAIERGAWTFEHEWRRDVERQSGARARTPDKILASVAGKPEPVTSTLADQHEGTFLGHPLRGNRVLIIATGGFANRARVSGARPLDDQPFPGLWKELRTYVDGLPSTARLSEDWRLMDYLPEKDHFLPATPRLKASVLNEAYTGESSHVAQREGFGAPIPDFPLPMPITTNPTLVLDRALAVCPDVLILLCDAGEIPLSERDGEALCQARRSLPQTVIVEVIPPRQYTPGLAALARKVNGRHILWTSAAKPPISIVPPATAVAQP